MKAIQTQLEINRVTIKKDDSISFSASTPALNDEELMEWRRISKTLVNALFEPNEGSSEVLKIKEPIGGKSPSSRQRGIIFLIWKARGKPVGDFELYYRTRMEKNVDKLKDELDSL